VVKYRLTPARLFSFFNAITNTKCNIFIVFIYICRNKVKLLMYIYIKDSLYEFTADNDHDGMIGE